MAAEAETMEKSLCVFRAPYDWNSVRQPALDSRPCSDDVGVGQPGDEPNCQPARFSGPLGQRPRPDRLEICPAKTGAEDDVSPLDLAEVDIAATNTEVRSDDVGQRLGHDHVRCDCGLREIVA